MRSIGDLVKKSVGWVLVGRAVKMAVNAGTSVVLARLLEPRTFGLFSIASLFLGFTKQLQTFGMAKAAVRLPELREDHLRTIFTVNALGSTALCAALWVAAPLLETLFREPAAVAVLRALVLGFLANPFSSVGSAIIERRMDFRAQTRANVLYAVSKAAVSLVLAVLGWGVWSLAAGQLAGQATRAGALIGGARWLPRPGLSRVALADLAGFGFGMFLKNAAIYVQERVDYFIVGRWLGAAPLGLYERAYRMTDGIVREIGKTTNEVLYAAYSRIQDERQRVHAAFGKVLVTVAVVVYPSLLGMALVAPSLVRSVFGPQWDGAAVPLQVLCVAGFFRIFSQLAGTLCNALGFVKAEAASRVVLLALVAAGCTYATRWGIVGVAGAILLSEALVSLVLGAILLRASGLRLRDLFGPQLPVVAAASAMCAAVILFQRAGADRLGQTSWAMLLGSVCIGAPVYGAALFLLRSREVEGVFRELSRFAQPLRQRMFPG